MYRKILVPFDNSDSSRRALENALEIADVLPGCTVTVLNVVEWQDYNAETFKIASRMSGVLGDSLDMDSIAGVDDAAAEEETKSVADEIAAIVGKRDNVNIAIANGSPHDTIVAYAKDFDFDCIAMGHRGMGMIRGVLGSVCYSVLQKATIPVLVVK